MKSPRKTKADSWSSQSCMPAAFLSAFISPSYTTLWWPWGYKTTTLQKKKHILHTSGSISMQKTNKSRQKLLDCSPHVQSRLTSITMIQLNQKTHILSCVVVNCNCLCNSSVTSNTAWKCSGRSKKGVCLHIYSVWTQLKPPLSWETDVGFYLIHANVTLIN